ncbi:MAG TPA: S41 family peptidase [Streptosporangiaceae bacterium]|nr:S41 family peptidase [Streptosporangiaceae bacterium]
MLNIAPPSGGYLRFPHIRQDLLAFVAEDDVWISSVDGARAWRLSCDRAKASHPRLSRDATMVTWTSWRDGPPDVHLAAVAGGPSRRLTYWGDAATRGWADGQVLAVSAHGQPFSHHTWAYAVPVDGGPPTRLPYGPVGDLTVEPGGTVLLTAVMGRDPAHWKRYRGGGTGQLWVAPGEAADAIDSQPIFTRILADLGGHLANPLLVGGRLAFLSDHEGVGNLYSCHLDGSDLRRHTDHTDFYARNASTDGRRIVYQRAGQIWLLDDLDADARPVDIVLGAPGTARQARLLAADEHLDDLSVDHTGRASAVEVQGTTHWLTHRDGPARALAVTPGIRARFPRVLGTTGQVVWVADAGGQDGLEVAPVSGIPPDAGAGTDAGPRRLAYGRLGMVADLCAAPDGTSVAVASRDGRLQVVDLGTGEAAELAVSDAGPVTGLAYSPDSAWLAWSHPGPEPLRRIRLARLADRAVVDVTDGRFADSDPAFTADGAYLAFLSRRSFDPVYDAHFFELSFPYGCRPYLVPLAAATASPFAPVPDGRPVEVSADKDGGDTSSEGSGEDGKSGEGDGQAQHNPVTVEPEGLTERVVQLPVAEFRYSSLRGVQDGLVWLKQAPYGALGESGADIDAPAPRPALERFDLKRRTCDELVDELDWFEVSGDGTRIVVCDHGDLRVIPSRHKVDSDDSDADPAVDLSRLRVMADPADHWRHAFDEAGRIMRHDFWVADMAGVDWDAILAAYRPLLDGLGGSDDFADLLWELLGELGTSHAYVFPAPQLTQAQPVGLLGADLECDAGGRWRVARVVPGESSDPRARSPLATPGAMIRPGDAITAVDGRLVDSLTGPAPLLVGAAGKAVELTVDPALGGPPRRAVVVPLRDEDRLRYQDWVAGRRRHVRELSAGRVGYLHVPDMMGAGWAQFHRDLRVEMTADALVVDVRGNRGGHVSQLVVEKLARRVIGWNVPRGLRPETYPYDAPHGPIVAVADEYSGSDGDIVTAAIRILRLGPVVGTRTWGGVIGIDGAHYLVDGTAITVPRHATWLDSYGWDVENHGVEPDVEIVMSPDDWARGADPQLDRAVELAVESLAAGRALTPPDTGDRPTRRRPPLPARGPESG